MKEKIRDFLNTGLLEQYVLGLSEPFEAAEVEFYIQEYPEVKKLYDELQVGVDNLMMASVEPSTSNMKQVQTKISTFNWMPIAAGAALVLGLLTMFLVNKNQQKNNEIAELNEKYLALKEECESRQLNFAKLQEHLQFINHSETDKHILRGNEKAKDFQVIAYWNNYAKKSMLRVNELPELTDNQCFQMWADVDGKMLNLGIIDPSNALFVDFGYLANATSLNVTIEQKGGNDHPTVADLVANVFI